MTRGARRQIKIYDYTSVNTLAWQTYLNASTYEVKIGS